MVRGMRGIMRMSIGDVRQHVPQSIEQIKVGAWVQVGGGESAGRMSCEDDADAAFVGGAAQVCFDGFGDIDDLVFSLRCNGDGNWLHDPFYPLYVY